MVDSQVYIDQPKPHQLRIEEMTSGSHWEYKQFADVLVELGVAGYGLSIPARNRPDSIRLGSWVNVIEELRKGTTANGREHSRVILVDKGRKKLVFSGRTIIGTPMNARLDVTPQPGREIFQHMIASVHTHPIDSFPNFSHGLSDTDYITFLKDVNQQAMVMVFGDNSLLVLKTSVTPNNLNEHAVRKRIEGTLNDSILESKRPVYERLVEFNKNVCAEFGLVLYKSDVLDKELYRRVHVTK